VHGAGADHPDLNAHNVLIGPDGAIHLIDFDRGRLREPGAWRLRNLDRLRRSIAKIAGESAVRRALPQRWAMLEAGYESRAPRP
jgi:3-deoxy-D-manno-octulosonic acid kinase